MVKPVLVPYDFGNQKIVNLADPTSAQDAATKAYVDSLTGGANYFKKACRASTTGNISLSGGAPNTTDGVTLAANDRVLVKDQSTASQNGIYYVSTLGSGSNGTWTRATDADVSAEVISGMTVHVSEGTNWADTFWVLTTDDPITLATTSLTFTNMPARVATQAEMEAVTLNTVVLTPLSTRFHPGVCKSWVELDNTQKTGTYSRTGTTVTCTVTAHGYVNGDRVQLDYTSGLATDGTYIISNVTTNTFTVTDPSSGSTSGNVTVQSRTRAAYLISGITDNGTGDFTVIWGVTFSTANYAILVGSLRSGTTSLSVQLSNTTAPTTIAARFVVRETSVGTNTDPDYFSAGVWGDM